VFLLAACTALCVALLRLFHAPTEQLRDVLIEVCVVWTGLLALLVVLAQYTAARQPDSITGLQLGMLATVALPTAAVLVLAVPEARWNASALLITIGVPGVAIATLGVFMPQDAVPWWAAGASMLGLAMVAAASLHPHIATVRAQSRALLHVRQRAALVSVPFIQIAGVVTLVQSPTTPALVCIGALAVLAPSAHTVLALQRSAKDRAAASEAVQSELLARDHERREVAQLIHNDALQHIIAAAWMSTDRPEVREQLLLAEGNLRLVLEGVRAGAPPITEIPAAIERLVRLLGTTCIWAFTIDDDQALESVGPVVWSVVREASVNVVKHARATHAWVVVERVEGGCMVVVADDGIGMPTEQTGRQFGLRSMSELVGLAGGTLRYKSRTPRGTEVVAMIPL
jgi:signal transduction histidine kinase